MKEITPLRTEFPPRLPSPSTISSPDHLNFPTFLIRQLFKKIAKPIEHLNALRVGIFDKRMKSLITYATNMVAV